MRFNDSIFVAIEIILWAQQCLLHNRQHCKWTRRRRDSVPNMEWHLNGFVGREERTENEIQIQERLESQRKKFQFSVRFLWFIENDYQTRITSVANLDCTKQEINRDLVHCLLSGCHNIEWDLKSFCEGDEEEAGGLIDKFPGNGQGRSIFRRSRLKGVFVRSEELLLTMMLFTILNGGRGTVDGFNRSVNNRRWIGRLLDGEGLSLLHCQCLFAARGGGRPVNDRKVSSFGGWKEAIVVGRDLVPGNYLANARFVPDPWMNESEWDEGGYSLVAVSNKLNKCFACQLLLAKQWRT